MKTIIVYHRFFICIFTTDVIFQFWHMKTMRIVPVTLIHYLSAVNWNLLKQCPFHFAEGSFVIRSLAVTEGSLFVCIENIHQFGSLPDDPDTPYFSLDACCFINDIQEVVSHGLLLTFPLLVICHDLLQQLQKIIPSHLDVKQVTNTHPQYSVSSLAVNICDVNEKQKNREQ